MGSTLPLDLQPDRIRTASLDVAWFKNDQMRWREELKEGKSHGDSKRWDSDGRLCRHKIHENGRLVKEIL